MKLRNAFFLLLSLIFFACTTDEVTDSASGITTTNIQASTMSDEIIANAESYIKSIADSRNLPTDSVIIYDVSKSKITVSIRDTVNYPVSKRFPNTVVIDFGNGFNSNVYTLKGKLIVYAKDTLTLRAISKKIIYKDFFVGENQLVGSKLIIYKGSFSTTNSLNLDSLYFLISSHDTLTNKNGQSVWNSYLTKQWIKLGGDTIKYITTGYAGGINDQSQKFTSGINAANPLIRYSSYPYIVKGKILITSADQTFSFDYGDGTLDNKGVFTYPNGDIKTIIIK